MLAAPKTPQTLDFIDYRGVCPQSYRVTGTRERVMGMLAGKIFAPAFRAPPPAPPRFRRMPTMLRLYPLHNRRNEHGVHFRDGAVVAPEIIQ